MLDTLNPQTAILVKARELISEPEGWCQRKLFDDGKRCAIGAVWEAGNCSKIAKGPGVERLLGASLDRLNESCRELGFKDDVIFVNNTKDHQTILQVFDRAIQNSLQEVTLASS